MRGIVVKWLTAWAQMPALFTKCVTLGKSLNFSVPQFLHKVRLIIVSIVVMIKPVNIGKVFGIDPGIQCTPCGEEGMTPSFSLLENPKGTEKKVTSPTSLSTRHPGKSSNDIC